MRFIFFFFLFFLISCGNSQEQKVETSIDRAQSYLTEGQCDKALSALDEARDMDNAIYLQVLASAHACKAGVNIVSVISEIKDINTTSVFSELSKMSFATTANLSPIDHLKNSLKVLLSSTSEVSQEVRDGHFGKRKGQDLGMQLLFYSVIQAAKFTNYFGNAQSGKKGKGDGLNTCFLNYNTDVALFFEFNPVFTIPISNSCKAPGDGHPDLDISTTSGRVYACQGVTGINNILDTLESLDFSNSKELKVLKEISEKISALKSTITTIDPSLTYLFEIRDTESCLELTDREVELFIFAFFEIGLE